MSFIQKKENEIKNYNINIKYMDNQEYLELIFEKENIIREFNFLIENINERIETFLYNNNTHVNTFDDD